MATENPKNSLFKNKFSANSQNFEHQKTDCAWLAKHLFPITKAASQ
jgi:hypothetical protein